MTEQSQQSKTASPGTTKDSLKLDKLQAMQGQAISTPPLSGEPIKLSEKMLSLSDRVCSDERTAIYDRRDRELAERQRKDQAATFLEQSGVSMRHAQLSGRVNHKWLAACKRLCASVGKGQIVMLSGDRGRGKTLMAMDVIVEACNQGHPSLYAEAMSIFIDLRDSYRSNSKLTERGVVAAHVKPSLLVIDAMEERGETAWEDRILNHIIDKRYAAMRDTILISNLPPDEFDAALGPSIVSRANESGGTVVCDWESFR
jgi:DNA replication protein DnaC